MEKQTETIAKAMTTALNGLTGVLQQLLERQARPMGASVDLRTPSPRQSPPGTASTALPPPPAAALAPPLPPQTSSAAAPLLSMLHPPPPPPPPPTPPPPPPTPPVAAAPLYAFRCPTKRPAAYHKNEADEDEVQKNKQRAREAAEDKARENELLRVQAKYFLEAQENEQLRESELLRIQDDEDEARENELLRARPVHFLVAQENERLHAQDEDNAQHPEQENKRLRIQAEIEPNYTVAARPKEFPKLGQPTAVAVAASKSETGVLCKRETGSTAAAHRGLFAADRQDYISKKDGLDKSLNAADAPTGNTLNEPEQRAFTTGLRPHAFGTKSIDLALPGNTLNEPEQCALMTSPRTHAYGTKSINLAACSRAKVKVGPLARIRLAHKVYITALLAAAFGNISHAVEVAYGAKRKDTHEEPNGARFGNISHAAEVSYGAELENAARAVLYGAVAHDVPLK